MNAAPPALLMERVRAGYRRRPVLHDLSFRLGCGEMVAVLGPNGAGKTTLLHVATGLLPCAAGRVLLLGRDVARLPAAQRAREVAVVSQEPLGTAALTVEELVMMGRGARLGRWRPPAAADHAAVEQAMAFTDTLHLRERRLPEMSGGERQRAVLAMALAGEPRLLLLDEPTSHLDMSHRLEVVQLLRRVNAERGTAILMSAHDLNLAAEFFPRLALLDAGRLAAEGTPDEVLRESTLRDVYHCAVTVQRDPLSGSLRVFPRPEEAGDGPRRRLRIHVVCGGGSGEALLRRLVLAGHEITCGVVNERDTDAVCAQALGVATTLERPFSPIAPATLARAASQAAAADLLIVCDVPFGTGNLANLSLAEEALRAGRRVLLNTARLEARDFTPGQAAIPRLRALLAAGAEPWERLPEALSLLRRAEE